jgi:hypothetical protein
VAELAAHAGEAHHPALQHHFVSLDQQRSASTLGMWVFIAQEILFFGGLFGAYTVYRTLYPDAFSAGSHHLSWKIGFFNTLVLIGSSLTMAMGVYSAAIGKSKAVVGFILATILLGGVFLGVKYFEYGEKIRPCLGDGPHTGCLVPGARFDAASLHLSGRRGRPRADLLLALLRDDRAARAAHDHRRADPADDRRTSPGAAATAPSTTRQSSSSGSTGTSSISSGSSCSRCST